MCRLKYDVEDDAKDDIVDGYDDEDGWGARVSTEWACQCDFGAEQIGKFSHCCRQKVFSPKMSIFSPKKCLLCLFTSQDL